MIKWFMASATFFFLTILTFIGWLGWEPVATGWWTPVMLVCGMVVAVSVSCRVWKSYQ